MKKGTLKVFSTFNIPYAHYLNNDLIFANTPFG